MMQAFYAMTLLCSGKQREPFGHRVYLLVSHSHPDMFVVLWMTSILFGPRVPTFLLRKDTDSNCYVVRLGKSPSLLRSQDWMALCK